MFLIVFEQEIEKLKPHNLSSVPHDVIQEDIAFLEAGQEVLLANITKSGWITSQHIVVVVPGMASEEDPFDMNWNHAKSYFNFY